MERYPYFNCPSTYLQIFYKWSLSWQILWWRSANPHCRGTRTITWLAHVRCTITLYLRNAFTDRLKQIFAHVKLHFHSTFPIHKSSFDNHRTDMIGTLKAAQWIWERKLGAEASPDSRQRTSKSNLEAFSIGRRASSLFGGPSSITIMFVAMHPHTHLCANTVREIH